MTYGQVRDEMLQELVDRVKGGDATVRAVRDALAPLKLLGTGLYDDAVGYVLEGTTPEVLTRVQGSSTGDLDTLFGSPARLYKSWVSPDLVKRVAAVHKGWNAESGVTARGRLYASADVPVVARLARLLAQACETAEVPAAAVPEWFYVLVYDGARRGKTDGRHASKSAAGVADRLTPAFLEQVAIEGGVPDADAVRTVLTALLHRATAERSWNADPRPILAERQAFDEYVSQNVGTLAAVTAGLGAHGKQEVLNRIGKRTSETGLAEIVATLAVDKAKGVRTSALDRLALLDDAVQVALLTPHLVKVPTGQLGEVVTRLVGLEGGIAVLDEALAAIRDENGKVAAGQSARVRLLEQTVERSRALEAPLPGPGAGPAAGVPIEIPGYEPLPDAAVEPGWAAKARKLLDQEIAKAREQLDLAKKQSGSVSNKYWIDRAQSNLKGLLSITDDALAAVPDRVTGAVATTGKTSRQHAALFQWLTAEMRTLFAEPGLMLAIRLLALRDGGVQPNFTWALRPYLDHVTDLRQVHDGLVRAGVPKADDQIRDMVFQTWWGGDALPPSVTWPYFAERPEILDRYLGGDTELRQTGTALKILREFPVLPPALLPRLTVLALGTGKTHRLAAQQVLEAHSGARHLAEQALADSKAEVRASAAAWLARIGDAAAVPALRAALKKERREAARAALLAALETLGDDISADLAPETLQAEAVKGLAGKLPASLGWFPFEQLPEVRWAATGGVVPRDVVRWWAVLATKLKSPSGEGLIARYIGLLDPPSRAALGSFVLRAWVAQDTRGPSVETSRAYADQNAQAQWTNLQTAIKRYPEYYGGQAGQTVEDFWKRLYKQDQATYLGSATQEKGLLALTVGMPGAELATTAQHYFAAHKGRRAQAEYLVRALAANGDRAAVQLLLAVSRRFKQRSVQETASALAQDIADRNGWDGDQLADRTVQTAGFDDDGILRLDLGSPDGDGAGERVVTGRITDAFSLELRSPAGKVVKALPAKRASDDDEAYAEAKRQLKESRAELKAVVSLQSQRFAEAMVTGRTWSTADWREFVLGHPLMSRLAARLVWAAELPGAGDLAGPGTVTFRPGDGGALIGVDDEDVTLPDDARVSLVHAATLGDDAESGAPAWRGHLADYEITPLFDQGLGTGTSASGALPDVPDDATVIDTRKGWLSDSFTIRGRATKLGYVRSQAEDAGWFSAYCREYPTLGITVEIEFTGAFLPEENITAAVSELVFRRTGTWGERGLFAIKDVPKVLLAVSYRDYLTVADGGAFDPDWEKKSQY
ncbi:DUF4132 domain-containing protein [Promicromonospora soli]|uniref:DUF4132 domain-containing protein n=1 Tax=Promicromonospora soli TaxID=2035533 RepID=A0A919KNP5_9MICO|nr:DUF4132 domain-containing protein [Promicromonospora soli]GHH66344.1 hypothetical protein GCM10017772_06140 [Promicromonospora soli]